MPADCSGEVLGINLAWERALNGPEGKTTYVNAKAIKAQAESADRDVRKGKNTVLPLVSYYGTGRLWDLPRDRRTTETDSRLAKKDQLSRLYGYRNSVDPRLSVSELEEWIERQFLIAFEHSQRNTPLFHVVERALTGMLEDVSAIRYSAQRREVMVEFGMGTQLPFRALSDGQRTMLSMAGDIARKAATLNPFLGDNVMEETPGVVLIDELDLHLHPKWQRHVIEDLRRTFPKIQFFATTHSPFLIQSLRTGDELIVLDGLTTPDVASQSIADIAEGIMGVPTTAVAARYEEMKKAATE